MVFAGRYFQLHPPLPAFLLMPFAAIWGMDTNQTAFSLVSGAIDAALSWWVLGRLRLSVSARVWLTIFFGAGTVMWFETLNGGSWDVSQIVAVGFTLGALGEVFGESRPGVIGILAGLSALARNDLALDFPIFIGLCYVRRRNISELLWMAPGFALSGIVYVGLNEARFNSVFDLGQFLYTPGTPTFAMGFFPQNINTLLFMAPKLDGRFPFIHPISSGQALTFTSPAFLLAWRAKLTEMTCLLLILGAVLAMIPSLFFNNNGSAQFGTRHYIHSFPFLLVLWRRVFRVARIKSLKFWSGFDCLNRYRGDSDTLLGLRSIDTRSLTTFARRRTGPIKTDQAARREAVIRAIVQGAARAYPETLPPKAGRFRS